LHTQSGFGIVYPLVKEIDVNDPFAEFDRPATPEEIEAILSKPRSEPLPAHWEMFDPPEVKRIRPEGL